MFEPNDSDVIGVNIEQAAAKKAVKLELVVPIARSDRGSRRTAHLSLSGKQARELYEALSEFYSTRD